MASLVKLVSVTKTYPMGEIRVDALRQVNFEVSQREFVAITGPSGSGKSTLMHIVGLLDRPTNGRVFLQEEDVSKLSSEERAVLRNKHIGFVFQAFNLLPKTSALDNVALPLIYSGESLDKRKKKANQALRRVGLSDRREHSPSQLSGGEQQRVAIARALVNNPNLILADEPTGNLDSKTGIEIMNLLAELNKQGNTVVLVTHELDIATSAQRVVELKDGKVTR